MKKLKAMWVKFICKQYRKHYPDPLDDMGYKIADKTFKSKTAIFNFMKENAIGGLKTIMRFAEEKIRKGDDGNDGSRDN